MFDQSNFETNENSRWKKRLQQQSQFDRFFAHSLYPIFEKNMFEQSNLEIQENPMSQNKRLYKIKWSQPDPTKSLLIALIQIWKSMFEQSTLDKKTNQGEQKRVQQHVHSLIRQESLLIA